MEKLLTLFKKYSEFQTFSTFFLILGFLILLKFALKRRKMSTIIPCRNKWFIDVFGDLSVFVYNTTAFNGYPVTAIFIQYITAFCEMFKKEKVFMAWAGYVPFIVLASPEVVEDVIKSTTVIKKTWIYKWLHYWLGTGLLTSTGTKWKTRRKLLTPSFHFDVLKDFLPIIHEKSMKLVKKFETETSKDYTDIFTPVTLCSLDVICETTLGVDIKAQENSESEYVKAVERVTDSLSKRILNIWDWFDFPFYWRTHGRKVKKDINLLHKFTLQVIKVKKMQLQTEGSIQKSKRKPLIDVLLEHHLHTKDFSEEDIREEIDTFAFEGHDTTATAMIWTLYLVGLNKDVQDKIHKELDFIFGEDKHRQVTMQDLSDMNYLECAIKESMRLYPPVPLIGRITETDININNLPIPANATIGVVLYTLHRDDQSFPNPEVFDPERFSPENSTSRHHFAYMPFSAGPRNCIGQRLAMMEMKTVVGNILRNFSLESLDPRDKLLPCMELILRPSGPVRIKISARKQL